MLIHTLLSDEGSRRPVREILRGGKQDETTNRAVYAWLHTSTTAIRLALCRTTTMQSRARTTSVCAPNLACLVHSRPQTADFEKIISQHLAHMDDEPDYKGRSRGKRVLKSVPKYEAGIVWHACYWMMSRGCHRAWAADRGRRQPNPGRACRRAHPR